MQITEEQRKRIEANRLAAIAKRHASLEMQTGEQRQQQDPWRFFTCRKATSVNNTHFTRKPQNSSTEPASVTRLPEKFRVSLEICSPDSFAATPIAMRGFTYPGEEECLRKLSDLLLDAIAIAGCFMDEGSILVVCPAVLRFSWAEELERWLPGCLPSHIHLVFGHQNNPDYLTSHPKIVVISYTMLHHLRKCMLEREWTLLIVDESHHLRCSKKKSDPEEVRTVLDVAANVKRIVLLSGTPSLSR